jgi:hypothetical protein
MVPPMLVTSNGTDEESPLFKTSVPPDRTGLLPTIKLPKETEEPAPMVLGELGAAVMLTVNVADLEAKVLSAALVAVTTQLPTSVPVKVAPLKVHGPSRA